MNNAIVPGTNLWSGRDAHSSSHPISVVEELIRFTSDEQTSRSSTSVAPSDIVDISSNDEDDAVSIIGPNRRDKRARSWESGSSCRAGRDLPVARVLTI